MPGFRRNLAELPAQQQRALTDLRHSLQQVSGPALCACVLALTLPILEGPQPPGFTSLATVILLCAGCGCNAANSLILGWAKTFQPTAVLINIWLSRVCIFAAYPLLAVWAWSGLFHLFMAALVTIMSVFALIGLGRARAALRAVTLMM